MPENNYHSIIVGGGIAGLVAANRAAELGLNVVVLEKGSEDRYLCNSRYTGGTFHINYRDIASPPQKLREAIDAATSGFARADIADAIATDAIRLARWLQGEGIRFLNLGQHHTFVLGPPSRTGPGLDWEGRGGDVLLRTLEANLNKRGAKILRGTPAIALHAIDGGYEVEAEQNGSKVLFTADSVILADGGFQSDITLLREQISPSPEKLQQRNARSSTGDALRMAKALGAEVVGTDKFYGHLLSKDAMTNDKLWPRPYVDALCVAGIVVDENGRRFADEGAGGVPLANSVARLPNPLGSVLIMDADIWSGPGTSPLIPANPHLPNAGGTLHSAATIAELAAKAGLPEDELTRTVAEYNAALEAGALETVSPSRSTATHKAMPIRKAPFYAVPMCVGITNTMGGILVDGHGNVRAADGSLMPGLFAAGACTGGLEGGPTTGYVGGLIKAVLGLRAAERISELKKAG